MTQGLTGAPATFPRLIDEVFRGLPSEMVLTYIDDILTKTSSTSFYDHMADLDATYTRIGADWSSGGFPAGEVKGRSAPNQTPKQTP